MISIRKNNKNPKSNTTIFPGTFIAETNKKCKNNIKIYIKATKIRLIGKTLVS